MKGLEPWNIWVGLSCGTQRPARKFGQGMKCSLRTEGLGPEIGFPEVGPRIGNHLEPCFHFVSFVSFISLAYHSPSRHCPRLIAPGFCDPLGRWWWCCALWKLSKSRKNMFIYMCTCVYVVINNRHRYIAWQYVVCKGTAHIGTCVPTYIQTYDCVCVCAYTNSYRCKHIYM